MAVASHDERKGGQQNRFDLKDGAKGTLGQLRAAKSLAGNHNVVRLLHFLEKGLGKHLVALAFTNLKPSPSVPRQSH